MKIIEALICYKDYLKPEDILVFRATSKSMIELFRDTPNTPYGNKISFTIAFSGFFKNIQALNDAWDYYQKITHVVTAERGLVQEEPSAVIYRLDDEDAIMDIQKLSQKEGDLKQRCLVYSPVKHFWNYNFVFMVAHIHIDTIFIVASEMKENNYQRKKIALQISAFARELRTLIAANYKLDWDHKNHQLLLKKVYEPTFGGIKIKELSPPDAEVRISLEFFKENKFKFMINLINTKVTNLQTILRNELKALELEIVQAFEPGPNMDLDADERLPETQNDSMEPSFDVDEMAARFNAFAESVCQDFATFCLSRHINLNQVYLQMIKQGDLHEFTDTLPQAKFVNYDNSDHTEKALFLVASFQSYLVKTLTRRMDTIITILKTVNTPNLRY